MLDKLSARGALTITLLIVLTAFAVEGIIGGLL